MKQIDWVRATFVGAMVGGFVWAVIIGIASLDFLTTSWLARAAFAAVVVNSAVLAVSWLLWRSATGDRGRTLAAALCIVPLLGPAFVAAVMTVSTGLRAVGA
jgi:hypothetical protein